jgi:NADPH-dependent 2,4-dienoyl-CoA reductase/sulfur reductase-like enzyme/rhodanese-related sulfurtransferase
VDMAKPKNIVIIGGTACGPKAAARARRLDQAANITIIEQRDNLSSATCGLPYFLSGTVAQSDLVTRQADYFRNIFKMNVLLNTKVLAIDRPEHTVTTTDLKTGVNTTLPYDKLVIATGASPIVPPWEGKNLEGVFTLNNIPDAVAIHNYLKQARPSSVVIVGAGLIGLEAAENLVNMGLKVTIVEALGWPLPTLLDEEVAIPVTRQLRQAGVDLLFGERVNGFRGGPEGKVTGVAVGGKTFPADMALMALGARPNVALAKEAGLKIGQLGGLDVNEQMQTSDPDIYAGGDCVEGTNIITKKKVLVPLGSTANKHGRIIGTNVTGGQDTFPGITGTASVKVFDINVGRTGLNEKQAREAGFEVLTALVPTFDHATYYPGSKEILVKLVAEKSTGRILGGQAVGEGDTIKRIDVLATAITFGANADALADADLAYAPPYNSAMDPLHNAANVIRNKRANLAPSLTPSEVKQKLDHHDSFVLLDVRSPMEWKAGHINAPQVKLLPLPELRKRFDELSKDVEIVTLCRTSIRAYQAQRILMGAGFTNVKFLDGSMAAWPYDTVKGD